MTCESGELFFSFFRQYVDDLLMDQMFPKEERGKLEIPYEFLRNHISGSFVHMIQWWMKRGLKELPEELSDYFMAVTRPVLGMQGRKYG